MREQLAYIFAYNLDGQMITSASNEYISWPILYRIVHNSSFKWLK